MKYQIIEDCSPYYIRFTHEGIDDVINYCNECTPNIDSLEHSFTHVKLNDTQVSTIIPLLPMASQMPLMTNRLSLFISKSGMQYGAHKDGLVHRFSINYTSRVLDDKCITSWYTDDELKEYKVKEWLPTKDKITGVINPKGRPSRECINFDKTKHKPVKTMVAKQSECILFNTEIWHAWDNSESTNDRVVLTLRIHSDMIADTYFEDARKILFDF